MHAFSHSDNWECHWVRFQLRMLQLFFREPEHQFSRWNRTEPWCWPTFICASKRWQLRRSRIASAWATTSILTWICLPICWLCYDRTCFVWKFQCHPHGANSAALDQHSPHIDFLRLDQPWCLGDCQAGPSRNSLPVKDAPLYSLPIQCYIQPFRIKRQHLCRCQVTVHS